MQVKSRLTANQKYKMVTSCIHTVYRLINSTLEMKDFLKKITKLFCQIVKAQSANIIILDISKNYSIFRTNIDKKLISVSDKKTIIKNRVEKNVIKKSSVIRIKNLMAVPLIAEDTIGVLILQKEDGSFDEFEQELMLTLSAQVVTAIKNLELYQEQQKIIQGTMRSMLMLLNRHSPRYAHSDCFLKIVDEIAKRMNLTQEERQSLKYASMLHDMGKINIPYEILTKSTTLTGEEFNVIKQHPSKGIQIIKHLKNLKPAVPLILHHHERFDGEGYPSHLKGDKIPLGSRIMSVADAFDAMVFARPYRQKITIQDAINEIKKNSGLQFDPKVVNEFLKVAASKKIKKILDTI